jgi:nitrogen fixation/metabolism regulation signal transduction histidine kinase
MNWKKRHQISAKRAREAWREMAKQVAHEFKSLTPMRLTWFSANLTPDPNVKQKMNDYSRRLFNKLTQ